MRLSRRSILAGAALGGGLVVAWNLLPRRFEPPLEANRGEVAFDAWLKIGADGVVSVAVPQLEMGQGITTLLPQIVAMELGADWRQMAVEPAPVSGAYANVPLAARWAPLWQPRWWAPLGRLAEGLDALAIERWAQDNRFTATAEGLSLAAFEQPCREAAASARALLCMAAAEQWGVEWEECRAENGLILHEDKQASFAALALAAAAFTPPDPPPLLPQAPADPAMAAVPEQAAAAPEVAFPRLDLPSKVDGSHVFAADVRLPGMVFAAIRHGPQGEAWLGEFDPAPVAGQAGLIQLVRGRDWLAAIGETWWAAESALATIAPPFGNRRPVDSETIRAALDEALRGNEGEAVASRGAGKEGFSADVALRYDFAPALHAPLETTCATARLADGLLELWLPTQAPEAARQAAARALGLEPQQVVLYPVAAGGSFDRRLEQQVAIEVALLAREAGRPVQLTWSRWQEHVAAFPRPPAAGLIAARLGPQGAISGWRARLACPPAMLEMGRRLFANLTPQAAIAAVEGRADPLMTEGLLPFYAIPDAVVRHIPVRLDLPVSRLRGGPRALGCFMRESFIDEVAHRHEREPLSYRIAMLGGEPRLVQCLQQAARLAQWDGGAPGTGQGLACELIAAGGATGRIALVATAMRGTGGIRVTRMAAAVDIGRVINRDIALQQIEGGLIYGLGLALGSATDYAAGLPTNGRLAALSLPRLEDCPEIAIELIASDAPPFDPGELAVGVVAPALANALYSASGVRFRQLPLLGAQP